MCFLPRWETLGFSSSKAGATPCPASGSGTTPETPRASPPPPGPVCARRGHAPPIPARCLQTLPQTLRRAQGGNGGPSSQSPMDHPPDAPLNQPARRPGPGPSPPEGPTQLGQGTMPTPAMVSCPPLPTTLPSLEAFLASSDQAHAAWPCDTQASPGDSGLQKPLEVAQNGCPCSPGP